MTRESKRAARLSARNTKLRRLSRLGIILLGLWMATPSTGAEEAVSERSWFHGRISGQSRTVYDYRSADDERDTDFYEYLYLSDLDLAQRRLDIYFSGRLHRDLEDSSASQADDIYASVEDVGSVTEDYLYEAYLDAHDVRKRVRLSVGRRYIDVADYLHIDGAQLELFENTPFGGRLFYGIPVSYYSSVSDDRAYGFSLVGIPWPGNQTRFTYIRYHDDNADANDERYDLDVRQDWLEEFRTRAQAARLNDRYETAGLDMYYAPADTDFDCFAGIHRWGGTEGETRQYSPLSQILGDRAPYTYLNARLSKGVFRFFSVSPGASARFVSSSDEDESNRDYARYDLAIAFEPSRAFSASVAGEYWSVDRGDSFAGLSGDLRYRHRRLWEVSAGAGYLHYEYEEYSVFSGAIEAGDVSLSGDGTLVEISPDSYTYFLSGKWNINKILSARLRGEIEDNSEISDISSRIQTTITLRF